MMLGGLYDNHFLTVIFFRKSSTVYIHIYDYFSIHYNYSCMLSVPNVSIITALHQRPVLQRPKPIPGDRSTMADNAEEAKASTNSSPSKASESKSSIKVPNFLSIMTYLLLRLPVVMVTAIIFSKDVLNLRWRGAFQRRYLLGLEINEIMILSPLRTGML